jgi:hypothetical protein
VRRHENRTWAEACLGLLGEILAAVNSAPAAAVNVVVCDLTRDSGVLG